jgi:hypothetical protein
VVTSVAGPLRAAPPPAPMRDDPSEEKTTVDVSPAHRHAGEVDDRTTNQTTAVRDIGRPAPAPRQAQAQAPGVPPQHKVSVWVFLAAFIAIALAAVVIVVILLGKKH